MESGVECREIAAAYRQSDGSERMVLKEVSGRFPAGRMDPFSEMKKEPYRDMQRRMRSIFKKDLTYKILIRTGRPRLERIKIVSEKDADRVVMGTKGKSDFRGLFFGATAERMFNLCPVPLMSVRLQKNF